MRRIIDLVRPIIKLAVIDEQEVIAVRGKVGNTFFIAFEGPDGVGKTTLMKMLAEEVKVGRFGKAELLLLREPPNNLVGKAIREILGVLKDPNELASLTQALLFFAARHEMFRRLERDYMGEEGFTFFLSDRSFISSFVYQSVLGGVPWEQMRHFTELCVPEWGVPDLVFLLDAPIEVIADRLRSKAKALVYDRLDLESLKRYRQAYLRLPELMPQLRFVKLDTTKDPKENLAEVLNEMSNLILSRQGKHRRL